MTDAILKGLSKIGNVFVNGYKTFMEFLAKPLGYLLDLLEGIVYFFASLFKIVVLIVKIFVALLQFFWAVATSVIKTLLMWIGVVPSGKVYLPHEAQNGFQVVIDKLMPTGIMTTVPLVATAFLWLFFGMKVFSLYGGSMGFSFPERKK
ncbi:hypothetical protein [Bacillus paranthracis]|uniref:hypothetical protein n=1 Tax=Bacillus paranthracis TaxID=2026186 RepID=UPI0002790654|nr:hypothetical protein [Bacillus paranthracis]EJP95780.1 hypothetical protein IC5_05611 [Bacillus cereus AND1407]MDG0913247.1 hypothetical protein [Bacillus paranthracis]MDR4352553.1 hypothetical protein [Bacillus paranthracis]